MKISLVKTMMLGMALLPALASAENVEIVLKDKLDGDLNDYCFDIVGGGQNIDPSNGLQTHTCYSYRGALGGDQAIDPAGVDEGKFRVVEFDVCATMTGLEAGATVSLSSCDDGAMQQFDISANGNISPKGAPGMCLTAGEETALGRQGTSRHQIKSLTLQSCSDDQSAYQQWYTRTLTAYNSQQPAQEEE